MRHILRRETQLTAGARGKTERRSRSLLGMVLFLALVATPAVADQELVIARFSAGSLEGWVEETFRGKTDYELHPEGGRQVLTARSTGSASGLRRVIDVDLEKTPFLTWHWKADSIIEGFDEHTKAGDDYPARVYVIVSGGLAFWRTRAINYVWSSSEPVESHWPNAFTERSMMVVVQSGKENIGRWVVQKRNVREDFQRYFGTDVTAVQAVAIMTDSDQTGKEVSASYGDITFGEY